MSGLQTFDLFNPPAPQPPEQRAAQLGAKQLAPGFQPTIRSYGDLNFWLRDEQKEVFRKWLRFDSPNYFDLRNEPDVLETWVPPTWLTGKRYTWDYIHKALEEGRANISRAAIMRVIGRAWDQVGMFQGKGAAWIQKYVLTPLDLARANLDLAGFKVAMQMQDNPAGAREAAKAFGIRTDISDNDMGGALTEQIADVATSQGLTLGQLVDLFAPAAGAGSILSEFWNDAKDWFNAAVTKNIGRVLVAIAEAILNARNDIQWLGTFFLDPLGISLLAEGLRQVGEYARTGDAAASFNERVLIGELGRHWTALGQALIVAGGMIAQTGLGLPFGAVIAAIGIVLYAAGNVITGEMRARAHASAARRHEDLYKSERDELAANCASALAGDFGVPAENIPRDPDKCIDLYAQQVEASENKKNLSTRKAAPGAGLPVIGLIAAGGALAWVLTRGRRRA